MKIKKDLKRIRKELNPSTEWKSSNREILMSQISAQVSDQGVAVKDKNAYSVSFGTRLHNMARLVIRDNNLILIGRPVLSLVLVFAVILGGGQFTVKASKESIPGNRLYFVKRALERAQLSLALENDKKIELHVAFSQERVKEIKNLTSGKNSEGNILTKQSQKIAPAAQEIKESFESIKSHLTEIENDNQNHDETVVEIAKFIDTKTGELSRSLREIGKEMPYSEDRGGAMMVEAAILSTDNAALSALEVMAKKYESGDVNDSEKNDISDRINKRIKSTTEEAGGMTEKATERTESESLEVTENDGLERVSSEGVHKTANNSEEAEGIVNTLKEASEFVEKDDLTNAIKKLSEGKLAIIEMKEKDNNAQEKEMNISQEDDEGFEVRGFIIEE